ncbi:ABC transporter substrate-binding protein [Bacillaceae bacterium S4-13-58]
MKKWLTVLVLAGLLVLFGCGTSEDAGSANENNTNNSNAENQSSSEGEKAYTVGVTQIVEHPSLDAALEGFQKALEDAGLNVEYSIENAQGDPKNNPTIADKLIGNGVDLIFANSTPSAQSVLAATEEIPIVFTSVTDPVGAELVGSMDQGGPNITGTTDTHPDAIPNTIDFMKNEIGIETIGVVYNAGEQNSVAQIERVKELADEKGISVEEATVSTSAEVKQATESLLGKVDAFYIITDNTVVSTLESVLMVGEAEKLPVFVGELDSVERGGFAAYGFDYYDIGYEAGEKAVQILKGEKTTAELPVSYPQNLKLVINKTAAGNMGVELKDSWNDIAELTE